MRTTIQPTVPLAEFGLTGLRTDDLNAWAQVNGVTLVTDYLGRYAVTLADAYKVGERREQAEAAARREAAIRSDVNNAQRERERVFESAMSDYAAAHRMTPDQFAKARKHAWTAVKEAEKDLPREIRSRLGGVNNLFIPVKS